MPAFRLLADEDFRKHVVAAVRRHCPNVEFETVQRLGLGGLKDARLLEYAAQEGWIVVSHDVHTMRPAAYHRIAHGLPMPGLFLAPQHHSTKDIVESLLIIVEASSAKEWANQVVFLPY